MNVSAPSSGSGTIVDRNRQLVNVLNNDKLKVDFKPLFECIHIYNTLGLLEELRSSYQADRKVFLFIFHTAMAFDLVLPGSVGSDPAHTPTPFSSARVYPRDIRILHH